MSVEATYIFRRTEEVKAGNVFADGVTAPNIIKDAEQKLAHVRAAADKGVTIELIRVEISSSHRVPDDE